MGNTSSSTSNMEVEELYTANVNVHPKLSTYLQMGPQTRNPK